MVMLPGKVALQLLRLAPLAALEDVFVEYAFELAVCGENGSTSTLDVGVAAASDAEKAAPATNRRN